MAGYRGGICADLAHERGHMRLFSRLPGGRPAAHREPTARSSNGFRPLTRKAPAAFALLPAAAIAC